jgi:hypothetical protein
LFEQWNLLLFPVKATLLVRWAARILKKLTTNFIFLEKGKKEHLLSSGGDNLVAKQQNIKTLS